MYLLAVSGGPDSMFLLNEYHRRSIVVTHVNYNTRKTSNRDEKIVRDFCDYHNIKLEVLNVKEKPRGNFESWARDIRYKFFKEVYDKYSCKALLTGHHRDDFLETALMQQRSGRNPFYFGIKKKSSRYGMKIIRPYINMYWKYQVVEDLENKKITFGHDKTNDDLKFTRNKIRKELASWNTKEKADHISWFNTSNKILKKKEKKVNTWFKIWTKSNYSVRTFRGIPKFKNELVFKYVHDNFKNINLSSKKLESLVAFVEGIEGNKKFKLDDTNTILKKDGVIKTL